MKRAEKTEWANYHLVIKPSTARHFDSLCTKNQTADKMLNELMDFWERVKHTKHTKEINDGE